MGLIVGLIINTISVFVTAQILPGVTIPDLSTALIVAVVLGVINTFIKPILVLLTLPINLLTLGLFTFVLNAFMIMLASSLVPGFQVQGFMSALLFSLVLSLISAFLSNLAG